ncbi:MAG: hypothetical protein V5789_06475 [Colwellia sp.]
MILNKERFLSELFEEISDRKGIDIGGFGKRLDTFVPKAKGYWISEKDLAHLVSTKYYSDHVQGNICDEITGLYSKIINEELSLDKINTNKDLDKIEKVDRKLLYNQETKDKVLQNLTSILFKYQQEKISKYNLVNGGDNADFREFFSQRGLYQLEELRNIISKVGYEMIFEAIEERLNKD